jgi:hypothetical protein
MGLIGPTKSNPHFMKGFAGNEVTRFAMLLYIKFFVHTSLAVLESILVHHGPPIFCIKDLVNCDFLMKNAHY